MIFLVPFLASEVFFQWKKWTHRSFEDKLPKRKETPGFVDFPTSTDGLGRYAGCEGVLHIRFSTSWFHD